MMRCKDCPTNHMLAELNKKDGLELMKTWFNNVCYRCKKTKGLAEGLCLSGDHINLIGDMSGVLDIETGGVYDEGDVDILEKGLPTIRKKDF